MSKSKGKIVVQDDSVLIGRIAESTERIEDKLDNHLSHHWAVTLAILVAFFSLVAAVIGAIVLRAWTWLGVPA